jgi:UPF0716 protein FxsA
MPAMAGSTGTRQVRMGRRFSAAGLTFALTVLAEVLAFFGVAHLIGLGWAFLALFAMSMVGLWLLKREGPRAWRRFQAVTAAGERPGPQLTKAFLGLVAAILVALPGFLTGVIGLALLIPPVRALAGKGAIGFATKRMSSAVAGDLFGPRRVSVKVGKTVPTASRQAASSQAASGRAASGPAAPRSGDEPIEGEIVG